MLSQSVSRASVRGGGSVGAESGLAEPNPARRGPPRPTTQPGAISRHPTDPVEEACVGGRRSHLCTSRTPTAISDPHATIGSDGRPGGLGWEMGSQECGHGIGEYLGAVRLAQNGSRLRSGPPFGKEPRWRRCHPNPNLDESCLGMSTRTLFTCHVHTNQRTGTNFLRCC